MSKKSKRETLTQRVERLEAMNKELLQILNFYHPLMLGLYNMLDTEDKQRLDAMGIVPAHPAKVDE